MALPVEQLLLPLKTQEHPDAHLPLQHPQRSLSPLFNRLYATGVEKMRRRRRPKRKKSDKTAFSPRINRIKDIGSKEANSGSAAEACNRLYASGLKSHASRAKLHKNRPLPSECTFMPSNIPRIAADDEIIPAVAKRRREKMKKRENDFAKRLFNEAEQRRHRKELAAAAMPHGCSFAPNINNRSKGSLNSSKATNRLYESGLRDIKEKMKQEAKSHRKRKVKMALSKEGADRLFKDAQKREERLGELRSKMNKEMTFKPRIHRTKKGKQVKSIGAKRSKNSLQEKNSASTDGEEPKYLGKEHNDVRGLAGVDDDLEDSMLQQASSLMREHDAAASPIQAVADDADQNSNVLCHAVAMYDYTGSDASRELSFRAGDIINVNEMDNSDGWWHGSIGAKWGAFPLSYVHCVVKFLGEKYLLLPVNWALHRSSGDKERIGTYNTEKKTLTQADGIIKDWGDSAII